MAQTHQENMLEAACAQVTATLTKATIDRMIAANVPITPGLNHPEISKIFSEVLEIANSWQHWLPRAFQAWPNVPSSDAPAPAVPPPASLGGVALDAARAAAGAVAGKP